MVVDDEPDITAIMKKALEVNGFVVDAFTQPNEALAHFKPDHYAMLITDIRMPGMNGFELYRQVKKIDDEIKVAFMTAFEVYEDEFKKVLPSTNVNCFFKKPMRMNEMVERVKQELANAFTMS
jgi:DNA-binding response OmpR family regulator